MTDHSHTPGFALEAMLVTARANAKEWIADRNDLVRRLEIAEERIRSEHRVEMELMVELVKRGKLREAGAMLSQEIK